MPTAHSLKERRSFIKGPIERARSRFNASIVELPCGNGWQTATVAVALLSGEENDARKLLDKILDFFENSDGLVVLGNRVEFL